jgi:hypothetical protein
MINIDIEINLKDITLNDLIQNPNILDYFILSSLNSYEKKVKNISHRIIRILRLDLDGNQRKSLSRLIAIRLQIFLEMGLIEKNENGYFLKNGEINIKNIYTSSGITIK